MPKFWIILAEQRPDHWATLIHDCEGWPLRFESREDGERALLYRQHQDPLADYRLMECVAVARPSMTSDRVLRIEPILT